MYLLRNRWSHSPCMSTRGLAADTPTRAASIPPPRPVRGGYSRAQILDRDIFTGTVGCDFGVRPLDQGNPCLCTQPGR